MATVRLINVVSIALYLDIKKMNKMLAIIATTTPNMKQGTLAIEGISSDHRSPNNDTNAPFNTMELIE
jgi:hypothetical protein